MLIKLGNNTIAIRWMHSFINKKKLELITRDEKGKIVFNDGGLPVIQNLFIITPKARSKRYTKCFISLGIGENSKLIATAIAKCHRNDDYNKCKGRKESLDKALEMLSNGPQDDVILDKEIRKAIWKKYAELTNCTFYDKKKDKKSEILEKSTSVVLE